MNPPEMNKINIEVDGKKLEATPGQMLIEVTDQAGIHIPRFCYHPKLSIAANCRMCLVDVEKAPKPLPACATPVNEGMVVHTQSELARGVQQGTMEFLLINHPLDCPICDQGGECPLQEQSIDYGANASRYQEVKRQAVNDDIGPLIATWMTRCIHCTRCVRFGEEIAGVMELAMLGRGEHAKIKTCPQDESGQSSAEEVDAFLSSAVNSEVSGNVIELCPVGALTAKPSKYAARVWEMQKHAAISPHDCVGTNLNIQTLRGEIMRTVVRENHDVNGYWLADRDRYSYEAVHSDRRLTRPMVKDQHGWQEVEWDAALRHAAAGLKTVKDRDGADSIGALASSAATVEELFMVQKLMRSMGTNNVDHRLRQEDFRDDSTAPLYSGSELALTEFETLESALLIGSNIRKEQPLLGLSLRQAAVKNYAQICALNVLDYDFHFPLAYKKLVSSKDLVTALANVAVAVSTIKKNKAALDKDISARASKADQSEKDIANALLHGDEANKAIILGATALNHFEASTLSAIAAWICEQTGAKLVKLPDANSAGAWVAGCVPHRAALGKKLKASGLDAKSMVAKKLSAYFLYGVEPGLDSHRSGEALTALENADFVVQCAAFTSDEAMNYADVLLPIATYAENSGTYINCVGQAQASRAAAEPLGDARPGWKVMRVLGNYLELDGFDYIDLSDVQDEIALHDDGIISQRGSTVAASPLSFEKGAIYRHAETPMYRIDATVRHAKALQQTADNPDPCIGLNENAILALGLTVGEKVYLTQGKAQILLLLTLDNRLQDDQAYIPAGYYETSALSGHDALTIEAR